MITPKQKTEVLELLDKANAILSNDVDTDEDILCCCGGLIDDVYDMETG